MAEFKLNRFKYNWRGDWSAGTDYDRDDIVRVGGKSYVCIVTHTASPSFFTDLNYILPDSEPPQPQPKWTVMIDGRTFQGEWETDTDYNLGDIVLIGGSLFICNGSHTSTAFEANTTDWTLYTDGIDAEDEWQDATQYGRGAVVRYGGNLYKCLNANTSNQNLENNQSDWEVFFEGKYYTGDWTAQTTYRINDIIKYGGTLYRCIFSHTSEDYIGTNYWALEAPGFQYSGEWTAEVAYNKGDYVRYGGNIYFAFVDNIDNPPLTQEDSTIVWVQAAAGYEMRGDWTVGETYYPGDIVRRGGDLYEALEVVNAAGDEDSTLDYLEPNWWRKLNSGQTFKSQWQEDVVYSVNEVVYYYGTAYKCNQQHLSSSVNFPGDNGNGFEYWDVLVQGGLSALNKKGDMTTYGFYRDDLGDESSLGPTPVTIGAEGQILSIASNTPIWRDFLNEGSNVVYVAPNGSDAPGSGLTPNFPFQTIRYAAQYVEDNFNSQPSKIAVSAGIFDEVCPIIVPEFCVVMGDELRSTTINANSAIPAYAADVDYTRTLDWQTRVTALLDSILINEEIIPAPGNTVPQQFLGVSSSVTVADRIRELQQDWKDKVEFESQNGDVNPTLTGSNDLNLDPDYVNAVTIIEANMEFLKEESFRWIQSRTLDVLDPIKTKKDVYEFLRGAIRDIKYSGNYATLNAATFYANCVKGSQFTDMFYLRDRTGLRNCTVKGLNGGLNPPGVFELYQRPTGGAFCSLDPGWGPDDERTWISNRSPYIQGVTTIGTNCVGQKIDGSLHNGGNKSFVSNDFTQVLSDGIGAWVLNGARAELVSVFTYYCAVGYLAEEGGIIRATNGNCSYGKYGAISNGLDPNEVPKTATVNNRNNEAVVQSTFAGEFTDKIFAFEFAHAGEEYTDASFDIVGAGQNANAQIDDYRFGGVFQPRIVEPEDSGIAGGAGYQEATGNAQTGTTTSITISGTDNADTNDYDDMRIIITSGVGTGQYGIVESYNTISKVITVIKESDGTSGWDHIVAGTAIEASLSTNTTYRIEPRIVANHPGFDATAVNLGPTYNYSDICWGQTTETYTALDGDLGTGSVDLATPIRARFNVTKNGRDYAVTMTNPGVGYAVGDTLTISGEDLGGATPLNDLVIKVTSTTEDSTNNIVTYTTFGIAFEGRWIATTTGATNALWSNDGDQWAETTMPSSGNWTKIVNGENKFVALRTDSTNEAAYSADGKTWTATTLPTTQEWADVAYGNGRFVAIPKATQDYAYSDDGITWTGAELPVGDDSTGREWKAIGFGAQRFVVLSGELDNDVAYSDDGINWTVANDVLPNGSHNWIDCVFFDNKFYTVSSTNGTAAYSLDRGETWTETTAPTPDDSTPLNWKRLKADQGILALIGDTGGAVVGNDPTAGPVDYMYTSDNGLTWRQETLTVTQSWTSIAFGHPDDLGRWIAIAESSSIANKIRTGARAQFRSSLSTGIFNVVKIWDPGSGYDIDNPCEITVFDNSFTTGLVTENRIGNRVIAQPTFINRGTGYRSSNTVATITGDGYADIIPADVFVTLDGLETYPGPGAQFQFTGLLEPDTPDPTDLRRFTVVTVENLGDDGSGNGTLRAKFRISPSLELENNLTHGTSLTIAEQYSQCRISGHDFLDIGTGNFEETNYPDLYAEGNFYQPLPANEVFESNGGRVFYTSTDQDGNFRAGELFAVEQATGIVTISADFFDLGGLSELALGGVRLGGSGTVVREFSTDPNFTEDSNNVIPTQRAISTFIANRLSEGGSELETNLLIAGQVRIGSESNTIEHTLDGTVEFPSRMDFSGPDANVRGMLLAQRYFLAKGQV